MAEVTRLELATSCVTGKHSNQLSYTSKNGGHNWARTNDPLLVRQVLSQLSYATTFPILSYYTIFLCEFQPLFLNFSFQIKNFSTYSQEISIQELQEYPYLLLNTTPTFYRRSDLPIFESVVQAYMTEPA